MNGAEHGGIAKLLTEGLQKGFAGTNKRAEEKRAGVSFEINTNTEGTYDDRYAGQTSAAGQEIARTEEEVFSRVYAGGTIAPEQLEAVGLTKSDVIGYLKQVITEDGPHIRLFTPFQRKDGEWEYIYEILGVNKSIGLTIGLENILYKSTLVFSHGFLLTPLK